MWGLRSSFGSSPKLQRWCCAGPCAALSVESCFFLAFVIFVDIRTFVESELLSQFSMLTVLLAASWVYSNRREQYG